MQDAKHVVPLPAVVHRGTEHTPHRLYACLSAHGCAARLVPDAGVPRPAAARSGRGTEISGTIRVRLLLVARPLSAT